MIRHSSAALLPGLVVVATLLSHAATCPASCDCSSTNEAVCYGNTEVGRLPSGLPHGLTSLVLYHHNLSRLAADTLVGLPSLLQLQLQDDNLHWLHPAAFQTLPQLRTLGLQNNYLEYMDPNIFVNNPQLLYMDLSGNYLHAPDHVAWLNSRSLQEFNVSYCHLDYLPDEAFQGLPELRVLHLQGNYLHFLRMRQLAPMQRLTHLYLQNNKINILLNMPVSPPLQSLEYMDLSGNFLKTLDGAAVQVAVALRQLDLRGNPLVCNCQLVAARMWLQTRGVTAPGYCAAPNHVVGADWMDVSILTCDDQLLVARASSQQQTTMLPILVASFAIYTTFAGMYSY